MLADRLPAAESLLRRALALTQPGANLFVHQLCTLANIQQLAHDNTAAAETYRQVVAHSPLGTGRDRMRGVAVADLAEIALDGKSHGAHGGGNHLRRRPGGAAGGEAPEAERAAKRLGELDRTRGQP